MGDRQQISLLSTALGIAADGASGPIYVTSMPRPPAPLGGSLRAFDLSGRQLWTRQFDAPPRGLKVGDEGEVWVAHRRTLRATAPDGSHLWAVRPDCEPDDRLDAFVVLRDGFLLAWRSATDHGEGAEARIERIGRDGAHIWAAVLPPVLLGGWVTEAQEREVEHDSLGTGLPRPAVAVPAPPRPPADFRPDAHQPLLVSGGRILATYRDFSTGLGISFCLDLQTGAQLWATPPYPTGHKAIAGRGEFLIGAHGPDAYETHLFGPDGQELATWDAHGMYLVSGSGTIRCLELDSGTDQHSRVRVLLRDGSTRDGSPVGGYHTSHPALTRGRRTVFCRNDRLWAVDYWMVPQVLDRLSTHDRPVLSRTLLLANGLVAVTRDTELLLFRTGLGRLEPGIWTCGDGNLQGNPVLSSRNLPPGPASGPVAGHPAISS